MQAKFCFKWVPIALSLGADGCYRNNRTIKTQPHYIQEDVRSMEAEFDGRLIKGIEQFNHGLFFECHETLEEIWIEEHGKDRDFYQGIIQIAAGYLKWEQGVLIGAIKLWRSGLKKLEPYDSVHLGVKLGPFVEQVKENLTKVEQAHAKGEDSAALAVPVLSLSL
jgi:uncharacterized protein